MRVKICGLTKVAQAQAIAEFGATALGFICVPVSPRYVTPAQIEEIVAQLPPTVAKIGVFADASLAAIEQLVRQTALTGIQLHGEESPDFCRQLRALLPQIELIKALRIKNSEDLIDAKIYFDCVDTLLLDAYHPHLLGGTGKTLNWGSLADFDCPLPWLLAGGLTPNNILEALSQLKPSGVDLSSGVEIAPGDKDLRKVAQLLALNLSHS